MKPIRIIAAAAATVAFAFAFSSAASARSCEDGEAACANSAAQAAPMKLDSFMTTWKPVSVSKRAKKSKAARKHSPAAETVAESDPAAEPKPAATEKAPPAETTRVIAPAAAPQNSETDGVAVTSFDEPNELDATADHVQVLAFNEINEIDLAAPPPPAPAETTGQAVYAPDPAPVDNSWIGKLLLAIAGTIAIAGATRFLVA